jgi:RNA polymerase sigma-70 factor (ECF subfamily)
VSNGIQGPIDPLQRALGAVRDAVRWLTTPPSGQPPLSPAYAMIGAPSNRTYEPPVRGHQKQRPEMDTPCALPRSASTEEDIVVVALLAKRLPSADGSATEQGPPRKPPRMAPISTTRNDDAARLRSIEQRENDAEIVRKVQAGQGELYRVLVAKYQQRVYGVVWGMVQNPEDAREITQETFIKAYKSLERFRFDSSYYTWLYRIAVNMAIDFKRRAAKRRAEEFDETRMQHDEAGEIAPGHMDTSPQKRLERKRLADRIQAAIDELPADQRSAIMLREVEGLSYKEIAEAMDCAEGTVMSRLFYGRKKLQEILRDER